jgi:putative membrane protein
MVLHVANFGEVREGQIAREKASAPAVRDFASMMVTEHQAASAKTETELFKAEIESADSTLSRQLDAESGAAAEHLKTLTGPAFDRAYMERQVDVHQKLLDVIDRQVLPHAKKKAVKEQVNATRATVQQHLTKAQDVLRALPAN